VTFQDNFKANNFVLNDYDNDPGLEQYHQQKALGYQSIFQFGRSPVDGEHIYSKLSLDLIVDAFEFALDYLSPTSTEVQTDDIGDGALAFAVFDQGHAVVVWDGKERINISIFTYEDLATVKELDNFHKIDIAEPFLSQLDGLELLLLDEQPRGVNHVINLALDTGTQKVGCWDKYNHCAGFFDRGFCKKDNNEFFYWMNENCPLSCGLC